MAEPRALDANATELERAALDVLEYLRVTYGDNAFWSPSSAVARLWYALGSPSGVVQVRP